MYSGNLKLKESECIKSVKYLDNTLENSFDFNLYEMFEDQMTRILWNVERFMFLVHVTFEDLLLEKFIIKCFIYWYNSSCDLVAKYSCMTL